MRIKMKITDYSKIAGNYDKNKVRYDIPKDNMIEELYNLNSECFTVLDLSCGTGNYLNRQIIEYPISKYSIKWIGIDKSEAMIKKAQYKNLDADLIIADAINIPLKNNSVNYIKNRFAFHHYVEKEKALKEIYRVLKQNGKVSIENLNHEYMRYSWVYKYFPSAIELDNERFPGIYDYYKLFENSGFSINMNIKVVIKKFKYKDIIEEVKNRDMSQLHIIMEEEYINGLRAIEEDSQSNENIIGDVAITEIYGEK
jgi:ubiquinone/menaquinone biosynthesis C-methylase UbiE